jgi:hypothetical protein
MRHGEYEQRRREIEAQFREDLELLRAGYQAKLRALEMLWLAPPGALPAGRPANETRLLSETLPLSETRPVSETLPRPEASEPPKIRRGQVMEDLMAAFPSLPEEFERQDILRALGYAPTRSTLYRVLQELIMDNWISVTQYSLGRSSARYAKVPHPS